MKSLIVLLLVGTFSSHAATIGYTDTTVTNSGAYVSALDNANHVGRGDGNGHRVAYYSFDIRTLGANEDLLALNLSFSDQNETEGDETLAVQYLGTFSTGLIDATTIDDILAASRLNVYTTAAPGYGPETVSLSGLDDSGDYAIFRITNGSFTIRERFSIDSIELVTGSSVPEPTSSLLIMTGMLTLLSRRSRS